MHLAICDDNMADRKQAERLVGREADKWIAKGDPIYSFSFGSAASLLASTITYDAVLIDISNTEGRNTLEVIQKLRQMGLRSAIIVCDPKINEQTIGLPENILFLPKPIKVNELHDAFECVKDIVSHYERKIELRGEHFTKYISEKEIEYAEQSGYGACDVFLYDGEKIHINVSAENFFEEIEEKHPTFVLAGLTTVINIRYVEYIKLKKVTMHSGKTVKLQRDVLKYTKAILSQLKDEDDQLL